LEIFRLFQDDSVYTHGLVYAWCQVGVYQNLARYSDSVLTLRNILTWTSNESEYYFKVKK